jgi:hydroxyacylglutathione hydrolase
MYNLGANPVNESTMSHLEIHKFLCRDDNYGVLVHDHLTGTTMSIDAPEASSVVSNLKKRGWQLTHILTTHHHGDHVDGNLELKSEYGCRVIGPEVEKEQIPGISKTVKGGDTFEIAKRKVKVYDCPGHTKGHIAFHFPDDYVLFAGDTLFAMGCGRVIEGTMEQMYHSVNQFSKLHAITSVFVGHEYTLSNARFALSVEPNNRQLESRAEVVRNQREKDEMTCPTTIGDELKTNPFMRCNSKEIRERLGLIDATDAAVFAELRERKNRF